MRNTLLFVALATIPLCTGCGLRHAHVASGQSLIPYQGRALHRADEFRLGFTLQQLPDWAVAYAYGHASPPFDSAAFFAPACDNANLVEIPAGKPVAGCHPTIVANSSALEVQYRWHPTRSVHPLASVTLGRLTTGYFFVPLGKKRFIDSLQSSTIVTLGGGGELNLARWLHLTAVVGYRQSFGKTIPNGSVSNSGLTVTSLLVVGMPWRDR